MASSSKGTSVAGRAVLAVAVLGLAGCTRVRDHQGYITDSALIGGIQAGIDNRDSVSKTLGRPSLVSEFDGGSTWYYWSRDVRQFAAGNPAPVQQTLLTVRFAPSGDVTNVQNSGKETIRNVSLYGRRTPTLGRKRNFFSELFGNIGAGSGGSGPSADNPTN